MSNYFLVILSGIFLLFSIIDIFLHSTNKVKRSKAGKIILFCLVILCLFSGYSGISNIISTRSVNDLHKYLAVKYLAAGYTEQAQKYINMLNENSDGDRFCKTVLNIIADSTNGQYSSALEKAQLLLNTSKLNASQKAKVLEIINICKKIIETQSGLTEHEHLAAQADRINENILDELFLQLNVNENDRLTYDAVFIIDEAVARKQFSYEVEQTAMNLINAGKNQDAYKAAIKYFFAKGDFAASEEIARKLVDEYPTINNKIIYTDILAQRVRNSLISGNYSNVANDEESSKLISKAEELKKEASEFDALINNESNQEKRIRYEAKKEHLLSRASDLSKQALLVPVKRAINYLLVSKPMLGDNTGMINMQIAKLYFVIDEIEKSREYFDKVLNSSMRISESSIIKKDIEDIKNALASLRNHSMPPESMFASSVDNIVSKVSQNIVPAEQATVNEEFKNSIVSYLKFSNLQLFISKVDYSKFPVMSVNVNISGHKNGLFGLVNDYTDKDFLITDTEYGISNFKLLKKTGNDGVNIAIILDHSGSMQGRPFEDAKLAVLSCIENKSDKDSFSVVTYNNAASIVSGLNRDTDILKSSVNLLSNPDGGTNISDGMLKGFETLASANGVKAMILLSDGQDNRSEEGSLEKILNYAKMNGIGIFTIGLGEVDENYMQYVAEQTGGIFFRADNTAQLYDIYKLLQKYIINNYTFEYTVEKNPDVQVRKCNVLLASEGISDTKFYNLGDEMPADEESYNAAHQDPDSLWIEQVVPSSLAISKVGNNTRIRVVGRNFDKEMKVMVGNFYSKDVKIISPTEADVLLPERLTPGFYSITAENPGGNRTTNDMAFALFRPGAAKKINVGSITIEANNIGKTSPTTFLASGNVIINGFLRSSNDLLISSNAPSGLDFSMNDTNDTIDLAPAGTIRGNGKLFVSYSKTKEDGTRNNFAALALAGKDYIVKNGRFNIDANSLEASFDDNESAIFKVKLPGIVDLTVGEAKIMSDGIEIKAYEGENLTLVEALSDAIKGTKREDKTDAAILGVSKKKTSFSISELSFKVAKEDILVRASVEIKNPIKLPSVEGTNIKLAIDNISGDEWVTVSGGFELDVNVPKFSGLQLELTSHRFSLNKIQVIAQAGSGIALDPYRAIRIFEIGGGVDGIAKGWKDFEIFLKAEAGVKLSSILGIDEEKVPKLLERVNELIMLSDMELRLQPVSRLALSSDLKVIGTKMMDVEMSVSKEGFRAIGNVMLDANFLGAAIGMSGKDLVIINNNGLYESISGNISYLSIPGLDLRNKYGFLTFSMADSRLMLEAGRENEYSKAVFDFNNGFWRGIIPEVVGSIS